MSLGTGGAPPATLSTLPLEVKARIVELAARQDERYKERWVPDAPGEDLVKVHLNDWRGRSLVALSETCKELNGLAAVHLFRTITGSKQDSTLFAIKILRRHSQHFRSASFAYKPASLPPCITFPRFLAAPLPNITHLRIDNLTAYIVLGDALFQTDPTRLSVRDTEDMALHRDAFRALAHGLESLALVDFSTDEMISLLKLCPALRSATIVGPGLSDDPVSLSGYLGTVGTLRHLILEAAPELVPQLDERWATPDWTTSLESLELRKLSITEASVAFIDKHAPSLRHLTLHLPNPTTPPQEPLPAPFHHVTFPTLISLTIRNATPTAFEAIAKSIAAATPSSSGSTLKELDLELRQKDSCNLKRPTFDSILSGFVGLERLRVVATEKVLPHRLGKVLSHINTRRGILATSSERRDMFLSRTSVESAKADLENPWVFDSRHQAITAALAHGGQLADEYLAEKNVEGFEMLFRELGAVWGHKLLRDD